MARPSHQDAKPYCLLVENSLGLMCVHDMVGILLAINPLRQRRSAIRWKNAVAGASETCWRHQFGTFLRPSPHAFRSRDSGIMRLQAKDGTERLWLYRNVLYEEPLGVLGDAQDVTERIKAERELRKSQAEVGRARDGLELRVTEGTVELQRANDRLRSEVEQRERVEEELLRTRKLEAIGRLAGGLAHAFNNLMTIVIGCESLGSELAEFRSNIET
jgi:C4-dicarboxylate-specific signal transduction histidine kinase